MDDFSQIPENAAVGKLRRVYTVTGTPLDLIETPLGGGGEGSVHVIYGYPGRVAKIYRSDADEHREKIEAMASISARIEGDPVFEHVSWPQAALYSDPEHTDFIGFGMRFVRGDYNLDEVYDYPPSTDAPITLREKVDYLRTMAQIMRAFHDAGQVIGDFNNSNIKLYADGKSVGLVDVDSFHARIGGRTFKCDVCMSGYMAPELIKAVRGTTFAECQNETFTEQTDNFSFAVHAFRMLFNGVHPYHCVALPKGDESIPAPLPLEKRVERGETPFFKDVAGVSIPPFAPDASMLPSYMRDMFERAFVDGTQDASRRPTAKEWDRALEAFGRELRICSEGSHLHWNGLEECPYCEADRRAGVLSGKIGPAVSSTGSPSASGTGWSADDIRKKAQSHSNALQGRQPSATSRYGQRSNPRLQQQKPVGQPQSHPQPYALPQYQQQQPMPYPAQAYAPQPPQTSQKKGSGTVVIIAIVIIAIALIIIGFIAYMLIGSSGGTESIQNSKYAMIDK